MRDSEAGDEEFGADCGRGWAGEGEPEILVAGGGEVDGVD